MYSRLSGATALALALSAQSALSLTPEEAWEGWQAMSAAAGQTISATGTARNGDTLVVSGISVGMTVPDGPVIASTIPEVSFRDLGDGSVEITYPPAYDVNLTATEGSDKSSATLVVGQEEMKVVASGTVDAPKFDFTAKALTLTAKDVTDAEGKPVDVTGGLTLSGLSGSYAATPSGGGQSYDSTFAATSMALAVKGSEPEQNTTFDVTLTVAEPKFGGKSVMVSPELMQAGNMSAALAAGFMVDGSYGTGPIALSVDATEAGKPGHVEVALAGSSAHVKLDAQRMDYAFGVTGGTVNATGFDIPMPMVEGAFAEIAYGVAMPVAKATEPSDFSALFRMVDLTMTEDLWNMFDPGGALKRDPVTAILDVKGTGAWQVDILDPAVQMDGPELPVKLFSLDLTQVLAKAAGAQVAATGALTFDNADLASYGGFPAPEGKVTVTLDGINALMDALVAIGVVSEDDVMGARMGLAMMAKPGAGPDQLVSEIEFRAGGSLFVNGVQMQ
ncbi:DUF2125 domain-containing protein [Rhodobacter sp. SGA-6-6]|uniref:DUF2125 domain-containing protein n=1 Tax=Rhodobacter sp. SGA-6-6 TaxID=2710882 RepID=UPI0013ED658F|nr:DUF2125 domain-containing protein [Rhodobacter sp. SGA-6-6]NGM44235.1 DUF2125 domain-containing protein [Rhodobacter sp. SGA-6-6]